MLYKVLSTFATQLSNHLRLVYRLTDEIVVLGRMGDNEKLSSTNKIVISLVNVERETASGIRFNYKSTSSSQYKKTMPEWQLSLYVLVVAAFSDKQYEEGLQILSGALLYIQNNNTMSLSDSDVTLTMDPVNLSFNELSNLWSISGGSYYPSILCKVRALNISSDEIKAIVSRIDQNDMNI